MEMKPTPRKTFLAAFTAAALAVAASGAAARGPGAGPGPAAGPHAPLALQRLAELKTALQLTPEQQTAWGGYEQAVTRAATGRQKLQQSMRQARGRADAMEDLRVALLKFNALAADEVNQAREALIARLSPEQARSFEASRRAGPGCGAEQGPGHGCGRGPGAGHGGGFGPGHGASGGCAQMS